MGDWFGLGILIEVRDLASQGLQQVTNSFNATRQAIDNFSTSSSASTNALQGVRTQLQDMMFMGMGMQQAGQQFSAFSRNMIDPLVEVTKQVASTGSQFENWRKTLKALYKDEALANKKIDWGMDLAAKTPFDVKDVTSSLIGFKAIGVEADTVLTSVNGVKQTMLEFIGDLASLRPDVGLQGVMLGVRNLMGGDGGKSLKMRMDMDLESILGRDFGDSTEQLMQDLADISGKIANGLMKELDGTWGQLTSNLEDQATRFILALGDNGMFDTIKGSLITFSNVVNKIDDDKLAKIGKNLSEAFSMIWKPIDLVVKGISKLVEVIADLVASNSFVGKLVTGFLAITGAVTGLTGIVLKFGGSMITTVSALGLFLIALRTSTSTIAGTRTMFQLLGASMLPLLGTLAKLAGLMAGAFAVWHFDIGGVRTMATSFVNTILYAFRESAKISRMGADDMINALSHLDMTKFGDRLTFRLVQLMVLWQAVCEAWSDYTLSDETFRKVQALGLLPLLETILDLKMRFDAFWVGFKEGFKGVVDGIVWLAKKVADVVGNVVNFLFPLKTEVDEVKDSVGNGLNTKPWELFGVAVGTITSLFMTGVIGTKIFNIAKSIGSVGLAILKLPFKVLGTIGGLFRSLGGIISRIFPTVGLVARALLGFGMAHPIIGGIILIATALIPVFIKLWNESEKFRTVVVEGGKMILGILGVIALAVATVAGVVITSVVALAVGIAQAIASAVIIIAGIITGIVLVISTVVATIIGVVSGAIGVIVTIISAIVGAVMTVCLLVQGAFETAFAIVKGIIETVVVIIGAILTGNFSAIGEQLKVIWQGVGTRIGEIWSNVASKIQGIWSTIQSFLSSMWNGLKGLWSGMCNAIVSFGKGAVDKIKGAWEGVTGFFSGIWDGIKGAAQGMFDWLSGKFSWLSDMISSAKSGLDKVGSLFNSKKKDGSHANGLSYVPYDGYIAELHKGEMVLTAQESKKYRKQGRSILEDVMLNVPMASEEGNSEVARPVNLVAPQTTNNTTVQLQERSMVNPTLSSNAPQPRGNTEPQSIDNSITFTQGSIQINVANGQDLDLDSIAKQLMQKIQREQQLRNTLKYRPAL